jgi:magnesium transporter
LEPDAELLHRVKNQFSLHHLAIEDAEHAHQHPRRRVPPWSYG